MAALRSAVLPSLVPSIGEEDSKRGLREEEPNERSFPGVERVGDIVVYTGPVRVDRFEPVGVSPGTEWPVRLNVDETGVRDAFVERVPLDANRSKRESKLRDHSTVQYAPLNGAHAQWRRRQKRKRVGGAVKLAYHLDGRGDLKLGREVSDSGGLGPCTGLANAARTLSWRLSWRWSQGLPHGKGVFFAA